MGVAHTKQSIRVELVPEQGQRVPKKNEHTRFVCISDTHNRHDQLTIPDGDVLIHGGDFTMEGKEEEVINFNLFLGTLPHPHKLIVTGNHDHRWPDEDESNSFGVRMGLKNTRFKRLLSHGICLENEEVTINGIRIHGCCWSFGDPKLIYEKIKEGINILVTHKPPLGILDGERGGGDLLLKAVLSLLPSIHVFGHIHEAYGTEEKDNIRFINASSCDSKNNPVHPPIVFDVSFV